MKTKPIHETKKTYKIFFQTKFLIKNNEKYLKTGAG
jgi:hypothetical protein